MLVFVVEGKPENPEKKPRSKGENQQQTQPTHGIGGPFLKGAEKFSNPESRRKSQTL